MARNPYLVLGVGPATTDEEIKKSLEEKEAALRAGGKEPDAKKLQELIEAAGVLLNPETRRAYDQLLMQQAMPSEARIRQRRRKRIAAGIVTLALAATGAAGWIAWDRGVIPGNPRALDLKTIEPVLKTSIAMELARRSIVCASVALDHPAPEVRGLPEVQPAAAPGIYTVTLVKSVPNSQPSRDRQLAQLEFLTKQGFFDAKDVAVKNALGIQPARQFTLTWNGFANSAHQSDATPCFVGGRIVYEGIKAFEKSTEKLGNLDLYDITYTTKFEPGSKWAVSAEAKELFSTLADTAGAGDQYFRLVRGDEGWGSQQEIVMLASVPSSQIQRYGQQLRSRMQLLFADFDVAEAKRTFETYLKSDQGIRQTGAACVNLNINGAGDDTEAAKRNVRHVITYQDRAERQEFQRRDLANRINTLEALVAAGAALRENGSGAMPVAGEPAPPRPAASRAGRGVPPAGPGWVRYRIDPIVAETLNMGRSGAGCVSLGPAKLEFVGVTGGRGEGQVVLARATFDRPPDIARTLAERIPAIELALTEGLALRATLSPAFDSDGSLKTTEGKKPVWNVNGANFIMPASRFSSLPASVQSLLPLTQQLLQRDTESAAIVVDASLAPASSSQAPALPPLEEPKPAQTPAPVPAPAPKKSDATDVSPSKASLHVVSVREAALQPGMTPQRRPEGKIAIHVTGAASKPVWLLVDAIEPVHWIVTVAPDSRLDRVLASGYYPQRVTVSGRTGVPVEIGGEGPRFRESDGVQAAGAWVRAAYSVSPASIQVIPKPDKIALDISARPATPPAPRKGA